MNWRRYSPFMTVALATAGAFRAHGFARRLLLSWAGVSAVGLALGAATGWYPPDRILMFAFCLPMLAAFGLVALGDWLGRWWLAWPVGLLLTSLIVAPAVRDWRDQFPYVSPDEVAHLTLAGRIATDRSQAGTPLVFVADSPDTPEALFLLTHTANVARAALPADRASDVYVFLGTPADLLAGHPSTTGDPRYDLASAASFDRIPRDRTSPSWSAKTSAIPSSSTRPGSPDGTRGSRPAKAPPRPWRSTTTSSRRSSRARSGRPGARSCCYRSRAGLGVVGPR